MIHSLAKGNFWHATFSPISFPDPYSFSIILMNVVWPVSFTGLAYKIRSHVLEELHSMTPWTPLLLSPGHPLSGLCPPEGASVVWNSCCLLATCKKHGPATSLAIPLPQSPEGLKKGRLQARQPQQAYNPHFHSECGRTILSQQSWPLPPSPAPCRPLGPSLEQEGCI